MTAGTNGFTFYPMHGGVTPPTSKLRAATEKILIEKTLLPTLFEQHGNQTRDPKLISRAYHHEANRADW